MPIDSHHPQYDQTLRAWQLVSDMLGGERAVKEAGARYLPELAEQTPDEYLAYRDRAVFVNVTGRTHEGLVGFLFRKDPQTVFPTELKALIDDCTLTGYAFYDWLKDTARAVLGQGRRGTLIEWDDVAQRPFLRSYSALEIINWRTGRVAEQMVLTQLVVTEVSDQYNATSDGDQQPDPYIHRQYKQWRVYDLLQDDNLLPFVRCQVWRRNLSKQSTKGSAAGKAKPVGGKAAVASANAAVGASQDWICIEETYPARRGKPLAEIPFVFHGANNHLPEVDVVPMESLAHVNVSHYRTSADLENGRHFTGLPTAWAAGFGQGNEEMYIGSSKAWVSDNAEAKCGYLEFKGEGLRSLSDAITEKQAQMSALGARMFDAPKGRGAEAYDTVRIKQTGETVTLTNAAIALGQSGSRVMQWALWWITPTASVPEVLQARASVAVNTEFVSSKLTSDAITALVTAWQMKAISYETLFFNFQEGEMYAPDTEIEDEAELIATPTVDLLGGDDTNGLATGTDTNIDPGVQAGADDPSDGGASQAV